MIGDLVEKFVLGGIFMWPILICTLIGFAISLERFQVLFSAGRIDKEYLIHNLKTQILRNNLSGALSLTNQKKVPLTNIISAGLNSVINNGPPEEVQTSMDAAALKEIPKLEVRLSLINTCANIATLLGLLGTVAGLIGAFDAVANVTPDKKAEMLANAIATAMNTTAAGLLGAIPLLGLYGYLSSRSEQLVNDIHESSVSLLNFIVINKSRITEQD